MANRKPFAEDEWYHCYNRGVDKRKVFLDEKDYARFLLLLYVSNGTNCVHISNLSDGALSAVTNNPSIDRGELLVDLGAYCLMPNHIHLIQKQLRKGGIALFMQKVFTGYTVYFNKKYKRSGPLFAGVFKSKHIHDDRYLKRAWSYVHLNPVELFEKEWKKGKGNIREIKKELGAYEYFSLAEFDGVSRSRRTILGKDVFGLFDHIPTTQEMLEDAQAYYLDLPKSLGGPPSR